VIAACEIGFWVLLAAGLATRYLLRLPKAGMVLLAGVPLVDVVMLVASVIDIQRGGEPSFKHSLAAIFIGVSVGFGHQTLKWADKWAAHYLAGAPRPVKPPKGGAERASRERAGQGYDALLGPAWTWTIVLVIDAIVSFSYSFDGAGDREKESV
jgi:hypothetical protein